MPTSKMCMSNGSKVLIYLSLYLSASICRIVDSNLQGLISSVFDITYDCRIFCQIEHGVHKSVTKTLDGLVKGQSPPPTDETITAVKW